MLCVVCMFVCFDVCCVTRVGGHCPALAAALHQTGGLATTQLATEVS